MRERGAWPQTRWPLSLCSAPAPVERSEFIRGQRSPPPTDQQVMCEGLVSPCVVEGRGQVHVPVQNDQQRTAEAGKEYIDFISIVY